MKKLFITLLLIFLFSGAANAKATQVEALTEYDSTNPPTNISFKVIENNEIENFSDLLVGDILYAEIVKTKDSQRLKQNATFSLKIIKVTTINGETYFPNNLYAKYTTSLDTVELGKNVALSIGNKFVKGISVGYRAVEGAIKDPEGNRAKSTGVAIVDATPLGYINKGEDLKINIGDKFLLNIEAINAESPSIIDEYKYDITK